jgi:hypothetical protein
LPGRAVRATSATSHQSKLRSAIRLRRAGASLPSTSSKNVDFVSDPEREPESRVVVDEYEDYESGDAKSDPQDEDWTEHEPTHRNPKVPDLGTTPSRRVIGQGSAPASAKSRAKAVDPQKGFCLLTNAPNPAKARQFCHVMPRSTPQDTVCFFRPLDESPALISFPAHHSRMVVADEVLVALY